MVERARRIPEATVARLPVYLRILLELADARTATISSERLAELAGVNAAKVRKDLSYLGSYGTRGVGYDVEYLLFQMSRELGLTHDWPVIIVGAGNLGQALANYGGFDERGYPVVALVDADPSKVGTRIGALQVQDVDRAARDRGRPRPHDRRDRHPGRGRPGGGRPAGGRGRQLHPELRPHPPAGAPGRPGAEGRPRRRAPDPELLPAASSGLRRAGGALGGDDEAATA